MTLRHFVYSHTGSSRDTVDTEYLLALAAQGRLHVEIGHHDWGTVAAVLNDLARGRLRGKAVLTVS